MNKEILQFFKNDQKITFIYLNPENLTIKKIESTKEYLKKLDIDGVANGDMITKCIPEFFGLEEFFIEGYKTKKNISELYSINPVTRNIDSVEMFYSFKVVKIQPYLLLIISDISQNIKKFQSVSQAYHENKLLRDQLTQTKDKLEDLLSQIFPSDVVLQLRETGEYLPKEFQRVTVLFTDFVGFTANSAKMKSSELIQDLDRYFTQFDLIADRFHMEKIKTIGDAYMCALGLSPHKPSHPAYACLAGLEIQRFMVQLSELSMEQNKEFWQLRLGMHTGPVIAGVIGNRKSAYDIWGNTVNVASRMETNSSIGKVNISYDTYQQIKDFFNCEYRGKINVKNKGLVDMYYVNRINPEFSQRGEGIIPNDAFFKVLEQEAIP